MTQTTITAPGGGSFTAYVASPKRESAGAVVLIQEVFGVNDAMRETANYVADLGFLAICPDLFWRIKPGIDLTDKSEAEWKQAVAYMNEFDQDRGIEDLRATVAAARTMPGSNGRVGTMGYCLGGRLAMMMALRSDADINISYYGVGLDAFLGELYRVHAPLLLHLAGEDAFFPAEARAKVLAAAEGQTHIRAWSYPAADHAFARVGGTHWQGLAAAIANGRSAEALTAALR